MTNWFIFRRVVFIAFGLAIVIDGSAPTFLLILGWLTVATNVFSLALTATAEYLRARARWVQ